MTYHWILQVAWELSTTHGLRQGFRGLALVHRGTHRDLDLEWWREDELPFRGST